MWSFFLFEVPSSFEEMIEIKDVETIPSAFATCAACCRTAAKAEADEVNERWIAACLYVRDRLEMNGRSVSQGVRQGRTCAFFWRMMGILPPFSSSQAEERVRGFLVCLKGRCSTITSTVRAWKIGSTCRALRNPKSCFIHHVETSAHLFRSLRNDNRPHSFL